MTPPPPSSLTEQLCEFLMKVNVLSIIRNQIPLTPSEMMFPSHVFTGILYIAWLMPPTLASSCHIHSVSSLSISCQPSQVWGLKSKMILHTQNTGKNAFEINIQLMKLLMPVFLYLLFFIIYQILNITNALPHCTITGILLFNKKYFQISEFFLKLYTIHAIP